jgi:hypothetical protein
LVVYDAIIDDERCCNAFGLPMSLNMLIDTASGFDYTGADCRAWMKGAAFGSRLQRRGCTKQLIKVEAVGRCSRHGGCRGSRPAPQKLTRSPRRPFETSSSRSVERARSYPARREGSLGARSSLPIFPLNRASRRGENLRDGQQSAEGKVLR